MYLALKAGNTSLLNRAQCGQLAEAYSITVTLALGEPRVMSSGWAVTTGASASPGRARLAASPKAAAPMNSRRSMSVVSFVQRLGFNAAAPRAAPRGPAGAGPSSTGPPPAGPGRLPARPRGPRPGAGPGAGARGRPWPRTDRSPRGARGPGRTVRPAP